MSALEPLYRVLQTVKSTSSGTGTSHYTIGATCGMKARLYEMYPYPEEEEESYEIGQTTATGKRKANGRRAGTFFHSLQQFWRTGQLDDGLIVDAEHADYDFELAVRSFKNYRAFYKNDKNNRGLVLGAEQKFPATADHTAAVRAALGDVPFTMRYDLLVRVDAAQSERYALEHGLYVEPGDWLVDYKLVASIQANTLADYANGFQGLAYSVIYNICNPDKPVKGLLFDITARVQKAEAKHFQIMPATYSEDALEIVRHGVRDAVAKTLAGAASPLQCHGKYGQCAFLKNGFCKRYGTFAEHEEFYRSKGET